MEKSTTIVSALKCPCCETWIYSRARHDFHACPCDAINVDGGFDYIKGSWDEKKIKDFTTIENKEIEIPATRKELYDDWNLNKNVYGRIYILDENNTQLKPKKKIKK